MDKITCGRLSIGIERGGIAPGTDHEPAALFELMTHDGRILPSGQAESTVARGDTGSVREYEYHCGNFVIRVIFRVRDGRIDLKYYGRAEWPEHAPQPVRMRFPWLSAAPDEARVRFPGRCAAKADGTTALQQKGLAHPPLCAEKPDGSGYAVWFPVEAAGMGWTSCRNIELMEYREPSDVMNKWIHPRITEYDNLLAEMEIQPLTGGWNQCFGYMKARVREAFDPSEYQDLALRWIDRCGLVHFSYAFGDEFFDYASGKPDIGRVIAEGEKFGGYDAVILWHEYPRLGIDAGDQWDLYDDYPGGRENLKTLIRELHGKGIRVLVPYKPWDRARDMTDDDTLKRVSGLIADLDIDGLFLDTMNTVPEGFREAMNAVKPGVLFMAEAEPDVIHSYETVTCSWNQFHTDPSMPEANLSRFLFPEHRRFTVARWHTGCQKDMMIERAVFNGMGLVIWQDVFGCRLPYTEAQKEKVREWKKLYTDYMPVFQTENAVPLLTTEQPFIYANGFFGEDRAIITLYCDSSSGAEGRLVSAFGYTRVSVLRGEGDFSVSGGCITGSVRGNGTYVLLLVCQRDGSV